MSTSQSGMRQGKSGDVWEKGARAGYAVSGALHIVLGFLIAQLAFGGGSDEASSSEALSMLADSTFGVIVLWVAVVAFGALAAWQCADALRTHDDVKDRVKLLAKAGVYAVLAFSAATIALGSSSSGDDAQAQGLVGTVLEWPGGQIIVGAVALGILIAGVFHIVTGVKKKFMEHLKAVPTGSGSWVRRLGMAGYIAKGTALVVVGVLFGYAAVNADADQAEGLNGSLEILLGLPGGPVIVVIVGLGFAAYGLYLFVRARYARM